VTALIELADLKELLARPEHSTRDKLLFCLAVSPLSPQKVAQIRSSAVDNGLRAASKWNISGYLLKMHGLVARTKHGWELTQSGKQHISRIAQTVQPHSTGAAAGGLRSLLPTINNQNARTFVAEAISCLESKLLRSAVVLSWVGAMAVLYDVVVTKHLAAFNSLATQRDSKWKVAKSLDDLARLKEFDFLQMLTTLSIIGKNVKDELEGCLKLRNGCGHPNSLVVGDHKAFAHVETLIQNVFSKF
jgi:hypothetical protein